ncbi:MAG: hypothetical protein AAF726_23630 [Planctomycetota bacterium]
MDTAEAVRGIAAREDAAQLLFDVAWQAPAAVLVLEAGEEGLQVLADEGVERRGRSVAAQRGQVAVSQGSESCTPRWGDDEWLRSCLRRVLVVERGAPSLSR